MNAFIFPYIGVFICICILYTTYCINLIRFYSNLVCNAVCNTDRYLQKKHGCKSVTSLTSPRVDVQLKECYCLEYHYLRSVLVISKQEARRPPPWIDLSFRRHCLRTCKKLRLRTYFQCPINEDGGSFFVTAKRGAQY